MVKRIKKYFSNLTLYDILFIIGFVLVLVLCLYKAPLEIQGDDESFYLTVPKRLTDGDIFIVDEWHGSQFAGFLMYPFMILHRLLFGFEGIVLHFRYLYVFFQALFAIIIYSRLKNYKLFAVLASLFFFIFTPYDIMSMSYNSMGLMLVTLSGTLMATSSLRRRNLTIFFGGLIFAGAVLCSPYLAAVYVLYSIGAFVYAAVYDKNVYKSWGVFTAGAGCLAVLFLALLLSRASISEIVAAIPNLLTDPEHSTKPFFAAFLSYFTVIYNAYPHGAILTIVYFFTLAEAVIDRNRYDHKMFYIAVASVIAAVMVIGCYPTATQNTYNHIMFPLAIVGLMSHIVTKHRDHKLFVFLYLGGLLYSMCIHFSSNQHIYAISMASTAANVGSIALIGRAVSERKRGDFIEFISCALIVVLIVSQLLFMVHIKINHKFASQSKNSEFTQTISIGPYKGLRVTPATEEKYMTEYATLQPLKELEGSVLYASDITWYYLETPNLRMGAYSAWLSGYRQSTIDRLNLFYEQYPDKIPDYIHIPQQHRWDFEAFKAGILDRYGYELIIDNGAMIYAK